MKIGIRDVGKQFGAFRALDDIDLEVESGELLALLGPSGSGKTTLLRTLAGLERPDHGTIRFGADDVTDLGAPERRVGFVFQHYALFAHMSVYENVAFGLRVLPRARRPSPAAIDRKVRSLLSLIRLGDLATRSPAQLSGGQRQRVAFARALAIEPRVLLLDEPFGALDARVRDELRTWLRRLHDELAVTSIFVTHDQEEALAVADRIAVMNEGKIEQVGTAREIHDAPRTAFVCTFLGPSNAFRARVEDGHVRLGAAAFAVGPDLPSGTAVVAYARPHELELQRDGDARGEVGGLLARVRHVRAIGGMMRVELETLDGAHSLTAELAKGSLDDQGGASPTPLAAGDAIRVQPRAVRIFPRAS